MSRNMSELHTQTPAGEPTASCNTQYNHRHQSPKSNQIKSHYLLRRPSSVVQGRQVQAYNYQIWNNTMPINTAIIHQQFPRSLSLNLLTVPYCRTKLGRRRFSVAAPRVWNSLSGELRTDYDSLHTFKNNLKTLLYRRDIT